ncbi:MAG: type II toxin-antitoxin system RelE/ParE family toxin [Bacteroidota bacterium]
MAEFKRTIKIYKNHFWNFYNSQPKKVQNKIDWAIGLVRVLKIIPKTHFDHITGSDGLWEIRTQIDNNIYRIFCCFDEGNLVILLSGFQKKTQKTPQTEIDKAERLIKEYFDEKAK